jgi:hypothetical protein
LLENNRPIPWSMIDIALLFKHKIKEYVNYMFYIHSNGNDRKNRNYLFTSDEDSQSSQIKISDFTEDHSCKFLIKIHLNKANSVK